MSIIITDGEHLMSEDLDALHEFATKKLKLKKKWFQDHPHYPRYDLTNEAMKEKAIEMGAVMADIEAVMNIIKANKAKLRGGYTIIELVCVIAIGLMSIAGVVVLTLVIWSFLKYVGAVG